jgi:hypothetical protein
VSPKQLQPWAQVNHILGFKITHQVDINFPVGGRARRSLLVLKNSAREVLYGAKHSQCMLGEARAHAPIRASPSMLSELTIMVTASANVKISHFHYIRISADICSKSG